MSRIRRFGNKAKSMTRDMTRIAAQAIALSFALWIALWLAKTSTPLLALALFVSMTR